MASVLKVNKMRIALIELITRVTWKSQQLWYPFITLVHNVNSCQNNDDLQIDIDQ